MLDAINYPVKLHIDSFSSLLLDDTVGDTGCILVIGDNWSGRLRVSHVNECGTDGDRFAGAKEESSEFYFAGRRLDIFQYGTEYVYGAGGQGERIIEGGGQVTIQVGITEEEIISGT